MDKSTSFSFASWRVFEVKDPDEETSAVHFVGIEPGGLRGVMSDDICEYYPTHRLGVTRAGTKCHLLEQTGHDEKALLVWKTFQYVNKITDDLVKDVTDRYCKPERIWS